MTSDRCGETSNHGVELERQALQLPRWIDCPCCGSTAIDLVTVELEGEFYAEDATQSFFECHECGEDSLYEGPQPERGYPDV